jgi:hypothetical protein
MKDRFMGENTCLLYDVMHYLEENNKTGLLLLVDFEKAFDSIEWLFLKKALNSFNFGLELRMCHLHADSIVFHHH